MDRNAEIESIANFLRTLYDRDMYRPFPYPGCRTILANTGESYEGFIPDLDLYFGDIAGYCSSPKRLTRWSEDQLSAVRKTLETSFFEMHPEYRELEARISPEDTPDLHTAMERYEVARTRLLYLIGLLTD